MLRYVLKSRNFQKLLANITVKILRTKHVFQIINTETGSHYTGTVTVTKGVTLTRWRISTGDLRKGVTKIRFYELANMSLAEGVGG